MVAGVVDKTSLEKPVPKEPSEWKELSRARWEALPIEKGEQQPYRAQKFRALNVEAAAAERLGITRSERTAELLKAAAIGETRRLSAIMEAGADIDAVNEYGQTALFIAAYHGQHDAVQWLIESRADVERPANGGSTPTRTASANGHIAAMQALVAASAEPGQTTEEELVQKSKAEVLRPGSPRLEAPRGSVTILIDGQRSCAGAGSCFVDNSFTDTFLTRLEELFKRLPVAERIKDSASDRSYYCDSEGWVQRGFAEALQNAGPPTAPVSEALAHMRFLHYAEVGGALPPHVDLARTDISGRRSTHTFILYLADCEAGGETVLLERMDDTKEAVLAEVRPCRGRLLLFPHLCPHLARPTVEVPKLLLRGEMYGSQNGLCMLGAPAIVAVGAA